MRNTTDTGKLLRTSSLLALAAVLAGAAPTLADGIPTTKPAAAAIRNDASVFVDLSALEGASGGRRLLVPGAGTTPRVAPGGASGRVILRPPAGIAPSITRPQPIRLRPPPGVAPIAANHPIQMARAAAPEQTKPQMAKPSAPIAVEPVKPPAPAVVKPAAPATPSTTAASKPAAPAVTAPPAAKPAAPAPTATAKVTPPPAATAPVAKPAATQTAAAPPPAAKPAATPPAAAPAKPVAPPPATTTTAAKPATPPAPPAAAPTAPAKPVQMAAAKPQAPATTTPAPAVAKPAPPPAAKPTAPANTASAAPSAPTPLTGPAATPPAKTVAAAPAPLVPSTPPAAAPAPAAEAAKETQVAALPQNAVKAPTPRQPDVYTISFAVSASEVPAEADPNLKALAARMVKDPALRVELIAYASDPQKSVSRSRRLSTERGVNVRKELLAAGVESTRINLRALGEQSGGGAPDRVDVLLVRR